MAHAELPRLLQSVGQSAFVRFFREFADHRLSNQEVAALLPAEYTDKSRNSRTSHARRIIKDGLAIEALELILGSSRADASTTKAAQELLLQQRKKKSQL